MGLDKKLVMAYAYLVSSQFLWSSNQVAARWLAGQVGPITLTALRWSIASLFLYILVTRGSIRQRKALTKSLMFKEFVLGISGIYLFNVLLFLGLNFVKAATSGFIIGFTPIIVVVLSSLLIKEYPTKTQALGATISTIGIVLIFGAHVKLEELASWIGPLAVTGSAFMWALYTVYGRFVMKSYGIEPSETTFYAVLFSLPFSLTSMVIEIRLTGIPSLTPISLLIIFYMSTVVAVAGFVWWYKAVKIVGPNVAGPFLNLIPIFTFILGYLLLGETIGYLEAVGALFVVMGALVATKQS